MQTNVSILAKQRIIKVAMGEVKADQVFKQACYLNVFTETWEIGDIAIAEGRIAGIGEYNGELEYTVPNLRVVPGLMDGHIHLESSLLSPAMFTSCVLSHGTTSVVCDPHEIANVMGIDGIQYMIQSTEGLPLNVYIMLPSCVPATSEDESFAVLSAEDLQSLYKCSRVRGLAEVMNYPGVLSGDEEVLTKLVSTEQHALPLDGHAPFLSGKSLQAYISSGIYSDLRAPNLGKALKS